MIEKFLEKWNRQDEDQFHFRVSVIKSALRVVAGLALMIQLLPFAGVSFIAAEVLGVIEEL